jgi:hypothetical protein
MQAILCPVHSTYELFFSPLLINSRFIFFNCKIIMDQACCGRAYHALGQVSLQLYCSVQLKCPVVGPPTLTMSTTAFGMTCENCAIMLWLGGVKGKGGCCYHLFQ